MLDFLKARFQFLLVRWFYCLVRVDNRVTQWTMTAHIYREIIPATIANSLIQKSH